MTPPTESSASSPSPTNNSSSGTLGRPSSASELIDRVLAAYGGSERLAKVGAYRMDGILHARRAAADAATQRLVVRPAHLEVAIMYPDRQEIRLLKGDRAWRTDAKGQLMQVEGQLRDAMVLQLARGNLPWLLDERRSEVKLAESLIQDGVQLWGVELGVGQGLILRAYVDPKTGLLARSIGDLTAATGSTRFETVYSDYRAVDGVMFAFHEENHASGVHTGSTQFSAVDVNPKGVVTAGSL